MHTQERTEIILLSTRISERMSILDALLEVADQRATNASNASRGGGIGGRESGIKLMCGRWPHLFGCNASNPVLSYQSRCNISTQALEPMMVACGRTPKGLPDEAQSPAVSLPNFTTSV